MFLCRESENVVGGKTDERVKLDAGTRPSLSFPLPGHHTPSHFPSFSSMGFPHVYWPRHSCLNRPQPPGLAPLHARTSQSRLSHATAAPRQASPAWRGLSPVGSIQFGTSERGFPP